ncbi:hypothetical protein LG59_1540 [Serratia ureilytica]|uniref:hypothetical protein n=1 Tax=Serratia TaxID=613 RepID=UPI00063663D0|nr:hypothetical protein [Serratia ureilytica]KKO60555.1 hypothetical protein LG59_1540 [Serratia ureilytica]MBN5179826.1 hypothetical protein [Serratia marcescens]
MNTFIRMDYNICKQKDFTLADRFVYAYLKGWQDSQGMGNVFPGIERIASDLNMSKSGISLSISKLKRLGFIYVSRKDRRASNNYLVRDLPAVTETAAVTTETPTIEEIANDSPDNATPDLPAPISEPESSDEPPVQQTDNDHSDRVGSDCGGLTAFPVEGWVKLSRNVWKSLKGRKIAGSKKGEGDTDARAYVINRLQHFSGPYEPVFNQWMREENLSF